MFFLGVFEDSLNRSSLFGILKIISFGFLLILFFSAKFYLPSFLFAMYQSGGLRGFKTSLMFEGSPTNNISNFLSVRINPPRHQKPYELYKCEFFLYLISLSKKALAFQNYTSKSIRHWYTILFIKSPAPPFCVWYLSHGPTVITDWFTGYQKGEVATG